jgi:succinate-semialdehyde dehydrogenase/glutarate-semialdehyde dehydrogenase
VTTDDPAAVVSRLLSDSRIRKLSFTGSTRVGQLLLRQAADNVLRTSMELGGNAPFIVFADADLPAAADGFVTAKLRNGGEACTAANRLYVHADIADEFVTLLESRLGAVRIGRGMQPGVTLGPLINGDALRRVNQWITDAVRGGAEVAVDGVPAPSGGEFISPAVLRNVPEDARLATDEIFGPVIGMWTFTGEDDVIRQANRTDYGLVAYAYTQDLDRAMRLISRLEFGMLGLNRGVVSNAAAPFGGIKRSGMGCEGAHEGLQEYQDIVYAALNT